MNDLPPEHPDALPYHIGIVDDDPLALRSLSELLLSLTPGYEVIWSTLSGTEALTYCRAPAQRPDLLIADMALEGMQGPSLCERIRRAGTTPIFLGVTSFTLQTYRHRLVEAGAQGLVAKHDESGILQAVRQLKITGTLPGFEPAATAHARISASPTRNSLTGREEEVLRLCADEGLHDIEIAERLHISPATVRKHLQRVLSKTGARTTRQAIATWLKNHCD